MLHSKSILIFLIPHCFVLRTSAMLKSIHNQLFFDIYHVYEVKSWR